MEERVIISTNPEADPKSEVCQTYHERKIGNTLYRITSVYLGEIDLGKALEDLVVRRVLREINKN
jgi:hypothetical protein